ncbi:unnamed protein product [Ilex paraguariensis]|uniref:Uncharacterized protein n=1 Tax=Ilex paraguariensis TaxID=185542 RepID=A0ABC8SZT9_9AQUA
MNNLLSIRTFHLLCNVADVLCMSSRPGSFDLTGHSCEPHEAGGFLPVKKSQDAAGGALFHMLKKAPPLRRDLSDSTNLLPSFKPETLNNRTQEPNRIPEEPGIKQAASVSISSSGLLASKTTADALEELQGYREMKDLLLRQAGKPQK